MAKLAASEAATYISHQVFPIFLLLFNERLIYNPTTNTACHQRCKATQTLNWPFSVVLRIGLYIYPMSPDDDFL